MKNLFVIFALLAFYSCTKKSTPEKTLQNYVDYRFTSSQEKDDLLDMTTGKLYERISDMDEEELKSFLTGKSLNKRKLKVLLKNCQEAQCFLTYILTYTQGAGNPKDFGIEVKKIAQLDKVGESWLLSDVSNVKTYIEAKKDLEVSAEGESEAP